MNNGGKLLVFKKENGKKELVHSFDLRMGINTVGRPSKEKPSDIEISGDEYMSRRHFSIEVYSDSRYNWLRYSLSDNSSRNGTYFHCEDSQNHTKLRDGDEISIAKGDEIRAGKTYFQIAPIEESNP